MGANVLCAEQWLSTHANTKADDWTFVGPEADEPNFGPVAASGKEDEQHDILLGFPLAGFNENKNTDNVLLRCFTHCGYA